MTKDLINARLELIFRIPQQGIQLTKLRKYMLRSGYEEKELDLAIEHLINICGHAIKLETKTSKSGEIIKTFHWSDDSLRQSFWVGDIVIDHEGKAKPWRTTLNERLIKSIPIRPKTND